jgi:hypothetical protein
MIEIPQPDKTPREVIKIPELDIKDSITLVEMYAYKYTKNILTESSSSYIKKSYVKDNGDMCEIIVPINEDDPQIPLQMIFNADENNCTKYYLYPNQTIYESKKIYRDRILPVDSANEWLERLNSFFGPLEFNIQGIHAQEQFLDTFSIYPSHDFNKTFSNIKLEGYLGYKHEIYEKILGNTTKSKIDSKPIPQNNSYESKETDRLMNLLKGINTPVSNDVLRSIASVIVEARSNKISDRVIFHILAKQYHPDRYNKEDIMKLINEIYDKKEGKFSL